MQTDSSWSTYFQHLSHSLVHFIFELSVSSIFFEIITNKMSFVVVHAPMLPKLGPCRAEAWLRLGGLADWQCYRWAKRDTLTKAGPQLIDRVSRRMSPGRRTARRHEQFLKEESRSVHCHGTFTRNGSSFTGPRALNSLPYQSLRPQTPQCLPSFHTLASTQLAPDSHNSSERRLRARRCCSQRSPNPKPL
jgi:hypothetical protein